MKDAVARGFFDARALYDQVLDNNYMFHKEIRQDVQCIIAGRYIAYDLSQIALTHAVFSRGIEINRFLWHRTLCFENSRPLSNEHPTMDILQTRVSGMLRKDAEGALIPNLAGQDTPPRSSPVSLMRWASR